MLVGVLVGSDYEVVLAVVVPWAIVYERARRIAYDNGWRLYVGRGLLALPEVIVVTSKFRAVVTS